jgi:ketosteroid isomerase-like protein
MLCERPTGYSNAFTRVRLCFAGLGRYGPDKANASPLWCAAVVARQLPIRSSALRVYLYISTQKEKIMSSNIEIVQKVYAAFGRGDVPAILEHIAPDMVGFGVVADATPEVPWHIQITKREDVPKFFQALAAECDFTRFEPHSFATGGDHVYASISFDVTIKKNAKKVSFRNTMHRFTFKNGRIVEWRGTEDTAKTRDAWAGR